ncbi:MAG: AraC family transcriptional regulator [Psychroserpens sp.]|uniref:AraC family transcriptional regulator n=1 Tax=Psychroserpens sp. TaxID=2020870 RepID=UPI003001BBA3
MIQEQKILKYKNRIVFERIRMSSFKRIPKLYQDKEACFMFINEGEFSIRTQDEFISFDKGKGLLAKCFDYFFETNKKQRDKSDSIEVVGVLLYPIILEELFQFDIMHSSHIVDYNVRQIQVDELLSNFKDSINLLLDNPELADETLIKTKLKEFVLLMSKTVNAPSQLDFLSSMFKKNTSTFKVTILNNLYSNLSIDELAHLCGMSLSTFKRKFRETFMESPKKFIGKMKLEKASKMLVSKEYRISDVAYDCGFETISTFNRSFKSHFGKSPTEYRLMSST